MQECESKKLLTYQIQLPDTDIVNKFLHLEMNDQLNAIELGFKLLKTGETHLQTLNNEEWKNKLKQIEKERYKIIDELTLKITNEKINFQKLIEKNNENMRLTIQQTNKRIKASFESDIEEYKQKLEEKNNLLERERDKNNGIYEKLQNSFDEKMHSKQQYWDEKEATLRNNYEEKLKSEREKNSLFNIK